MSVELDHAARIAALARLRFDDEELQRITQELNQVLEYVEELKSLEVDDIPGDDADPLSGEGDATRGAEAEAPDELRDGIGALSADARDGFFVVPPLPGMHAEGSQ